MNSDKVPANRKKLREEASAWWVRVDGGFSNTDEQAAFQQWLTADPLHKTAFDEVNGLWNELDGIKDTIRVPDQAATTPFFTRWQWGFGAFSLCCALLLLMSPIAVFLHADFHTGVGETRSVVLEDGSTVYLNSQSAVSVNFGSSARELSLLQGEALFQVSPDQSRPFQVHAGSGTVTALGTAFNVSTQASGTEVTVTEHSVAVSIDQNRASIEKKIVTSGQQLTYSAKSGFGEISSVDIHAATAWLRGKLVFQDKPLGDVIAELNKYHPGYFLIRDKQIAARRVNGVFPTDKPVEALGALEKSLHLHSTRLSDYFVLLHQ